MRVQIWHVDSFTAEPSERGRSKVADAEPRAISIGEGLAVFAAVEQADEAEPEAVAGRAAEAIATVARQLGAHDIALHSFAHLFVEKLSTPQVARDVLNATQLLLESEGFTVTQSAFGWFNRLEIQAKGHPYSRIARQV